MRLSIADIRLDPTTQPRTAINYAVVDEYTADIEGGAKFPPIVVYFDGKIYWLADGYHRVYANQNLRRDTIEADVREGAREDAVWFSCGANKGHGLRRTNPDKQRAVDAALALRPDQSDALIAQHCGVSDRMVAGRRPTPKVSELKEPAKRIGADGKARSLPQPKPRPIVEPKPEPAPVQFPPEAYDDPDGDSDDGGDADEAPVPECAAPRVEAPKPEPVKTTHNALIARDRLVAEVVGLGFADAKWVCERVLRHFTKGRAV
jgi:hypothetical protein